MLQPNKNENLSALYIDFVVATVFDDGEKKLYYQLEDLSDQCFQLAKENKLEEAEAIYHANCDLRTLINLHLKIWIDVFCGQRISYFYYKKKDFEKAIALTNEIINASRLLYSRGYQFLFFWEIQQLLNLNRIYFAINDKGKAVQCSIEGIQKIVDHSHQWSTGTFIFDVPEQELIDKTAYDMLLQIISETCIRILTTFKKEPALVEKMLLNFVQVMLSIDFSTVSSETMYKNCNRFFLIAKHFLENGVDEIDDAGVIFLKSRETDKLLLKTLFEIAKFVSQKANV